MTWLPFIRTHVKPAQAVAGVAMAAVFITIALAIAAGANEIGKAVYYG